LGEEEEEEEEKEEEAPLVAAARPPMLRGRPPALPTAVVMPPLPKIYFPLRSLTRQRAPLCTRSTQHGGEEKRQKDAGEEEAEMIATATHLRWTPPPRHHHHRIQTCPTQRTLLLM
jgi:hypothetical protein